MPRVPTWEDEQPLHDRVEREEPERDRLPVRRIDIDSVESELPGEDGTPGRGKRI